MRRIQHDGMKAPPRTVPQPERMPLIETLEVRRLLSISAAADVWAGPRLLQAAATADASLTSAAVTRFRLVNARTDSDVSVLASGATLDLRKLGSQLSVRAETSGAVGSVKFILDGRTVRIENAASRAARTCRKRSGCPSRDARGRGTRGCGSRTGKGHWHPLPAAHPSGRP